MPLFTGGGASTAILRACHGFGRIKIKYHALFARGAAMGARSSCRDDEAVMTAFWRTGGLGLRQSCAVV